MDNHNAHVVEYYRWRYMVAGLPVTLDRLLSFDWYLASRCLTPHVAEVIDGVRGLTDEVSPL